MLQRKPGAKWTESHQEMAHLRSRALSAGFRVRVPPILARASLTAD